MATVINKSLGLIIIGGVVVALASVLQLLSNQNLKQEQEALHELTSRIVTEFLDDHEGELRGRWAIDRMEFEARHGMSAIEFLERMRTDIDQHLEEYRQRSDKGSGGSE